MAIQRAPRPSTGFTLILDDVLRDSRLSYRARGVLAAILSRPDNWVTTAVQLAAEGKEGREAIRAALTELDEAGYIERQKVQGEGGHWSTQTIVFDQPRTDDEAGSAQPERAASPAPGNPSPVTGNPSPETDSRAPVNRRSVSRALRRTTEKKTKDEEPSSSPTAEAVDDHDTTPTDPEPSEPQRDDVNRLCKHLADRIEGNGSKRPTITVDWRRQCRLMLDRDDRSEAQVHTAIDWCQDDPFWMSNVMSMPKLREQYDTLRLRALEQARDRSRARPGRQDRVDGVFDAAAVRLGVTTQPQPDRPKELV